MQDPDTIVAKRISTSINLGTEIFIDNEIAEWTVSNSDIIIPNEDATL